MGLPYKIIPYSIQSLKDILSDKSGAHVSIVEGKLHTTYFEHYFRDLGAKTILIENNYVDRDYMEDYAGFYARCFGKYERSCTRLHFFGCPFTSRQFANTLVGKGRSLSVERLQQSYLGFVVVKKLPRTFIGRTCLKSYDEDNGRRYYPTLRDYSVGLYGIELKAPKTLAFQEQDRGASACATSALWTVFQATGKLYQHTIPSPVEITKMATQIPDETVPGVLPSRGLTGRQEIYAMRQLSLEAEHTSAQDEFNLTGSIYAYLRAGIPLLLRVILYDVSNKSEAARRGGHALAVTGFSLGRSRPVLYDSQRFQLKASKIDKLYVHDDQVGPFARMLLDGVDVSVNNGPDAGKWYSLSTSWRGNDGRIGSVRAVPRFTLIPLYPKIRIRFEYIRDIVMSFDVFIRKWIFGQRLLPDLPSPFEWDIFLTTVNSLKSETYMSETLDTDVRRKILLTNMPRFMWRAKVNSREKILLEFLFDATDIEQGRLFICCIEHDRAFYSFIRTVAVACKADPYYRSQPYWRILESCTK